MSSNRTSDTRAMATSDEIRRTKELVDVGSAIAAADAADTLAAYLQKVRPDLEESILSIRGLGEAIRRSLPESFR